MLDQPQCERILAIMANHSVEDKLRAINEAKDMFRQAFRPEMNEVQWAYSAMVIEQQYNYIREILQVKQIRIKADLASASAAVAEKPKKAAKAPKPEKPKSKYAATFDMEKIAASFAKFQKDQANSK